jgi:GntR family transcriptional regulator
MELLIAPDSEVPIYVQVKNQVRMAVDKGEIEPGVQLPTVRELALQLGINANTVSRIYADLEREGYLVRKQGIGTFAASRVDVAPPEVPGEALLRETVRQLRALGYSTRRILEMAGEALQELDR